MAKQLLDDDKNLDNEIEFKQALIEAKGDKEKAKYVFCELYYKKVREFLFPDYETDIFKEIIYELNHERSTHNAIGYHGYNLKPKYINKKNTFCEQLKRDAKDNPDAQYESNWRSHYKNVVERDSEKDTLEWDRGDNLVYALDKLGNKKLFSGWYIDFGSKYHNNIFYIYLGVIIIMITDGFCKPDRHREKFTPYDKKSFDYSKTKKISKKEENDKIDKLDYQNLYYLRLSEDTYCELEFYPPNTDEECFLGQAKTYTYDHDKDNVWQTNPVQELLFFRDGNLASYTEMEENNKDIKRKYVLSHPSIFKNDNPYTKDKLFYKYVYEYSEENSNEIVEELFFKYKSDLSDSYLKYIKFWKNGKFKKRTELDEDGNELTILKKFLNWINFKD